MFTQYRVWLLQCALGAILCVNHVPAQCHTWSSEFVQSSPANDVYALQPFDDGTGPALWVAGDFIGTCCPNLNTGYVAKWDGNTWHATDSLGVLADQVGGWNKTNPTPPA